MNQKSMNPARSGSLLVRLPDLLTSATRCRVGSRIEQGRSKGPDPRVGSARKVPSKRLETDPDLL